MTERSGADAGPPMTLGAGLRRWFCGRLGLTAR